MPNERQRLVLHFKSYNASQLALTVEKNVPKDWLQNFWKKDKFDTCTWECLNCISSQVIKLAKVPNERPCLALHFKLYNASQLDLTVEKNVSEVALRNFHFFLKSCFFSSLESKFKILTFKVVQRLKSFPLCYYAFKSM